MRDRAESAFVGSVHREQADNTNGRLSSPGSVARPLVGRKLTGLFASSPACNLRDDAAAAVANKTSLADEPPT